MGNHVRCLDRDAAKIQTLDSRNLPIPEPSLLEVVQRNVVGGRLQFTTDVERAVVQGTLHLIPVGTADKVRAAIAEELAARGEAMAFAVLSNPELLKEGAAVADFMRPDRVVISADDERATLLMRALSAPL